MRHNKLELYVHLVWTTWDRAPLIDETIEARCIVSFAAKRTFAVARCWQLAD